MEIILVWIYFCLEIHFGLSRLEQTGFEIPEEPENYIKSLEIEYNESLHPNHYNEKSSLLNPIRIYVESQDLLKHDPQMFYYLTTYIYPVKDEIEQTLGIKYQMNSPLKIPPNCNEYIQFNNETICASKCEFRKCVNDVPDYLFKKCRYLENNKTVETDEGSGMPHTDFYLKLLLNKKCVYDQISYSFLCARGLKNRPIMGALTMCSSDEINYNLNPVLIKSKVKHSLLHLLGFNKYLSSYFLNNNGEELFSRNVDDSNIYLTYNNSIIKEIDRPRKSAYLNYTIKRHIFTGEKTLEFAREHFNCSSLDGIDIFLTNNAAIHFVDLIYGSEIMSSITSYFDITLSNLTLSFLEDTGWYYIDYSKAQPLNYGKNLGCSFAMDGCYNFINESGSMEPYCNKAYNGYNQDYFCPERGNYYANCLLKRSKVFDKRYAYFTKLMNIPKEVVRYYNSLDEKLEYCPILAKLSYGETDSQCDNLYNRRGLKYKYNQLEDYFGLDSKCFPHVMSPIPFKKRYGASCHRTKPLNSTAFYIYYKHKEFICFYNSNLIFTDGDFTVTIPCGFSNYQSRLKLKRFNHQMNQIIYLEIYPILLIINVLFN